MFLESVTRFFKGGELEFPDQPRPAVAAHRPPPGAQQRDIAASLGITERSACGIVTGLTTASHVIKQNDGRRSRCQIQAHLPLPEPASQEPAIGEVLALLAGAGARLQPTGTGPARGHPSRGAVVRARRDRRLRPRLRIGHLCR
jgi:hypothetical protein